MLKDSLLSHASTELYQVLATKSVGATGTASFVTSYDIKPQSEGDDPSSSSMSCKHVREALHVEVFSTLEKNMLACYVVYLYSHRDKSILGTG